nr:ferredoxin [Rhodococcus qingshengii]
MKYDWNDLCRGHQMCVLGLPQIFEVGDDDEGRALVTSCVTEELKEKLLDVARSCPESAIVVEG